MIFERILNFLFPKKCIGCGRDGVLVCEKCLSGIKLLDFQENPFELIVASRYDKNGLLKKLITTYKYKFSEELRCVLAGLLAAQVQRLYKFFEQNWAEALVVPVPLHSRRLRSRGYNQSELLAYSLLKNPILAGINWKISNCLKRKIYTVPQVKLGRAERLVNLKGAFECENFKIINGKKIILIDDVCTTGATLSECKKVLIAAGAAKVTALVLAHGDGS
jgi:competence protein ComFC